MRRTGQPFTNFRELQRWATQLANHERDDLSAFASHMATCTVQDDLEIMEQNFETLAQQYERLAEGRDLDLQGRPLRGPNDVNDLSAMPAETRNAESLVKRGLLRDRSADLIFERWYRTASVGARLRYWESRIKEQRRG